MYFLLKFVLSLSAIGSAAVGTVYLVKKQPHYTEENAAVHNLKMLPSTKLTENEIKTQMAKLDEEIKNNNLQINQLTKNNNELNGKMTDITRGYIMNTFAHGGCPAYISNSQTQTNLTNKENCTNFRQYQQQKELNVQTIKKLNERNETIQKEEIYKLNMAKDSLSLQK